MYSESRFVYGLQLDHSIVYAYDCNFNDVLRPLLSAVGRMKNLEIVVRGDPVQMVVTGNVQTSERLRDAIMDIIIGARTERDTLRIKIANRSRRLQWSPLFQKLSLMTGFSTVFISLVAPASVVFDTVIQKFHNSNPALQSGFGSAKCGSTSMLTTDHPNDREYFLKYHPRKHHAETLGRAAGVDATVGNGLEKKRTNSSNRLDTCLPG